MPSGTVLDAIGGTPAIQLCRIVTPGMARVFVKLEGSNPTGSKKDRMAREVILAARADGRLKPGQPVVEYTGGSTGTSLAFVCSALGHPITVVSSDAFSREKLDHMAALGATVEIIPSPGGLMNAELFQALIARAQEIRDRTGAFWTDQLNNSDAARGYEAIGEEAWHQVGPIHAYVDCVGTAHGILGVGAALRRLNPAIRIVGVEPAESPFLSTGRTGGHRIEGIGIGFKPPLWASEAANEIRTASTADSQAMARRLARDEGVFTGTSSGANVIVALQVAAELGPGKTVLTVAVDTGLKYVSTEVYRGLAVGANAIDTQSRSTPRA